MSFLKNTKATTLNEKNKTILINNTFKSSIELKWQISYKMKS